MYIPRKTFVLMVGLAVFLSVFNIRQETYDNVPPCHRTPACSEESDTRGTLREYRQGYPLAYRDKSTYTPEHNQPNDSQYPGYTAASSEREGFKWLYFISNIGFWFAVIYLARDIYHANKARTPRAKAAIKKSKKSKQ